MPFVSVTLTNFASPTWVMSYVAAACADGVMNAAGRHASTDSMADAFSMNRDCDVPMPMAMRRA